MGENKASQDKNSTKFRSKLSDVTVNQNVESQAATLNDSTPRTNWKETKCW